MKVPTYHKFGLKKSQIAKSDAQDKKISDVLTHNLTILIGSVLGIAVYIIYYNKVKPSTFIQVIMQVFLFASMGVLCVGIPAVLFKLVEMFYFKQIKHKSESHKTIQEYRQQRDEFDFWKIRKDYSFWNTLDGLSFEKEIMNVYMHLGYEIREELNPGEALSDSIIYKNDECWYLFFNTKSTEMSSTELIDEIILKQGENNCNEIKIFSQKGFNKKVTEYCEDKPVFLYDISGIVKVVRSVTIKKTDDINDSDNEINEEIKN